MVYENGLAAGQALRLYWFPTLNASRTQPGTGVRYGAYRAAIANSGNAIDADGSGPWFLPADGTSGHTLLFLTADAGSLLNTANSGAAYGQTEWVTDGTAVANTAPAANDDVIALTSASALDLLSNDSDPDGDTLTITAITQPVAGTAALNNGVVTYTPGSTFTGRATIIGASRSPGAPPARPPRPAGTKRPTI